MHCFLAALLHCCNAAMQKCARPKLARRANVREAHTLLYAECSVQCALHAWFSLYAVEFADYSLPTAVCSQRLPLGPSGTKRRPKRAQSPRLFARAQDCLPGALLDWPLLPPSARSLLNLALSTQRQAQRRDCRRSNSLGRLQVAWPAPVLNWAHTKEAARKANQLGAISPSN